MKKIILGLVALASLLSLNASADALQSCHGCHGKNFEKSAMGKSKIVSIMSEKDIVAALKGYKDGSYGGKMKGLMKGQVQRLSISPESAATQIVSLNKNIQVKTPVLVKKNKPTLKDRMGNCKNKVTAIEQCISKAMETEDKMQMKKCKMQIIKLAEHIKMQKRMKNSGKCGKSN